MYNITLCVRTWREVRNFAIQKFRLTVGIPQSWESFSCSDFGYNHRSNRNLPMFLPKKWPDRLLLLPKLKSDSGSRSGFSQIFDSESQSGSERKTQNPAGVDSGTPDPVQPLVAEIRGGRDEHGSGLDRTAFFSKLEDQDWIGLRKFLLFNCDYSEHIKHFSLIRF